MLGLTVVDLHILYCGVLFTVTFPGRNHGNIQRLQDRAEFFCLSPFWVTIDVTLRRNSRQLFLRTKSFIVSWLNFWKLFVCFQKKSHFLGFLDRGVNYFFSPLSLQNETRSLQGRFWSPIVFEFLTHEGNFYFITSYININFMNDKLRTLFVFFLWMCTGNSFIYFSTFLEFYCWRYLVWM